MSKKTVFLAISGDNPVVSETKAALAQAMGISVSSLKRDLSAWVEIKGWRVRELDMYRCKARGSSIQ